MRGAGAWLKHAGHTVAGSTMHADDYDQHFLELDQKTGKPLSNIPYRLTLETGLTIEGLTNHDGLTETISSSSKLIADLEIPYYGNSTNTIDSNSGQDACHC